jgi:anti-sigma B factor antagonist
MTFDMEHSGAVQVVTFTGPSLDASNNREFVESFSPYLTEAGHVIFDMSHLRFVDSSGLGSLMLCLRRLKASGGTMKLCGLSKSVLALFELVRMNRVFEIYPNREEALRAYKEPAG